MTSSTPIYVIRRFLSDGSEVFDVGIGSMTFECLTETHALEMAEAMADAINAGTTVTAEVAVMF